MKKKNNMQEFLISIIWIFLNKTKLIFKVNNKKE